VEGTLKSPVIKKSQTKKGKSPLHLAFERFARNKMALAGAMILTCIVLISISAPLFTNMDPSATDLYHTEKAPDSVHLLGTDKVGHDVFARLLYGGRISLMVGVMTMILTIVIGGTVGAISGYYGGKVDALIMRVTDVLLTLPTLLMILFLVSILEKTDAWLLIITLGLTAWSSTARLVRGEFLSLREREYVLSARAIGCSDSRIMFKHILLNTLAPLTVNATLLVGNMILVESALSYLGFGVPQTTPTWGNMLNAARNMDVVSNQPWVWIPPGIVIIITVLAINFIGDGLRDAFDTRSTRR
jgi:peptide/nickel transport system permease protein